MRKIIFTVLGILLIVVSFFLAGYIIDSKKTFKPKSEKVVKTVFTEVVENGTVPIIVSANGNLTAKQRVELYAEVQGVFKKGSKLFKEGQSFRKGETIINIDADEYAASVQSAKSNLFNQLTAVMPDLRLDYPDIYSKWQDYLTNFDMSKSTPALPEMATEKEKFFISGRGILTSYYNVKNLEQRLSKYRIVAPFSGVLTETLVTEGTLVRSGQKLGEFINTEVYELEVAISKRYTDLLKVGESVELTNLDDNSTYKGKVTRINGSIDQATQTVNAYIEVEDKNLREGMYLEADLDAKKEENAIEVDRGLLLEDNKIFVVRDSILDVIDVEPVYFSDKRVVLKNVPNGVTIVSKPISGAYTGMAVKIYAEQPENTKG
ncbi:MAG: HlyD family efflux transporter periplasmic adaptor subunit [Maribacter dokdonensis]|mgnify:CR=1 FL=1|uniref:RND family efflux transporter, MFP subunit n=1 Tax=Maribacter dokdonensis TaxID=320912 RepID=A0A1H4JWF5_9FLAO|nr:MULTISPECIES: HlyD family efflux transporter periplasmic adaptor subunit [Maribacter]PHN95469.1 efflux transporter periplasmic adaptor subunit [Maribacter sp. 6B07]CAG2534084.1 MFP subunit [Maribacter dokdonensis]SDR76630.1 RND family efflux transporter, MFP subunit [Maribacter dokdonensis]SEB50503.1 RND family efflux transporter, MFP subunit [Maribacter dokdonensis]|tara:strand:- start:1342 stop:2472 length:1131 start_codon:yes stop_codon:yes gene_type:complete